MTSDHFGNLPDEIIIKIFSYIDTYDLALSVQYVCWRWKELSQRKTLWKNRVFQPEDEVLDNERVHLLENMPSLQAYVSTFGRNTELIIDTLCRSCHDIKHIHLRASHKLSYSLLEKITVNFPNIEKLIIPFLKEENSFSFAEHLSTLQRLTTIGFTDRYAEVPDGMLKIITDGCPSLQHVDLGDNIFKDADIRYLLEQKQHNLKSFSVDCYISCTTFKLITECKNLEHLHYDTFNYSSDVSYQYIQLLPKLVNLKSLQLGYLKDLQGEALSRLFPNWSLTNLKKLRMFVIDNFSGKDLGVVLKNCPNITHLTFAGADTTLAEGLQHIGHCKNLVHLSLGGCNCITPQCIDYVAVGCPRLRFLDISCSTDTTDDVILSVLNCKELRTISISYGHLKGTHFHLLPRLLHLEEIIMHECGISDEILDNLLKVIPHLKLTAEGNPEKPQPASFIH